MQSIRFGDYVLIDAIHTGETTEIYRASRGNGEDSKPNIAIKRLVPDFVDDEQAKSRLKEEARIAMQLTHGNIAQLLDSGDIGGEFFIATEYVHGKSLRDVFLRQRNRSGRLPLAIPCFIAIQVCEGLQFLHEKKNPAGVPLELMHCAVAPENVVVSYDGQVKLIDFSRARTTVKASDRQTEGERWLPGYLSPEQAQPGDLDRRSDIFQVGILLYELLTGERLFSDATDFSALQQVRNVDIPSPRSVNRQIPEELETIILKALARDRVERYQTALELHDQLQSFTYDNRQLCGRKELGDYVLSLFEEGVEELSAEDETLVSQGETEGRRETTGLIAFEDLEPVAVTKLTAMESLQPPGQEGMPAAASTPPRREVSTPPPPPPPGSRPPRMPSGIPRQPTLLGIPTNVPLPVYQGATAEAFAEAPTSAFEAPTSGFAEATTSAFVEGPTTTYVPDGSIIAGEMPVPLREIPPSDAPPPSSEDTPTDMSTTGVSSPGSSPSLPGAGVSVPPIVPALSSIPAIAARPPEPDDSDMDEAKTGLYAMSYELRETLLSALAKPGAGAKATATATAAAVAAAPLPDVADNTPTDAESSIRRIDTSRDRLPTHAMKPPVNYLRLGAIGATVLVLLVGFLLMKRPAAGSVSLTTSPADTLVKVDGQPFSGTSSPFLINGLKPNAVHQIAVSKDGFDGWSTVVEVKPGQKLVLPPVSLDPIQTDTGFTIDSKPSAAKVFLDGKDLAQSTPARVVGLTAGIHDIRIESGPGYASWKTQVKINNNQVVELPLAELTPLPTAIARETRSAPETTASAKPAEAPSWLRGSGKAPAATATSRPAVTVRRAPTTAPAAKVSQRTAAATRPSTVPSATAASKPSGQGMLRINTRPWSQVFIDNRLVGNTPLMGIPIPSGKHNVTLVNPTFGMRKSMSVSVRPGETITKIIALNP